MAEIPDRRAGRGKHGRRAPSSCGGCDQTWTARTVAHCGACHRTFGGVGLFDDHRSAQGEHGSCIDPESIRNAKTGERVMFLRDGMWRGPEMTEEQKARAFGGSAA